ncbi:MAG TPA: GNAT family N-acetyltransferase, partial [Longimicrobium sp.]|nr:GNAT family N-acetyltransferase [Longimicrobium sp.]
ITPERLRPAEPLVVPHAGELADYSGAYLHAFGGAAPVVSLPPSLLASHGERVAEAARGDWTDAGAWAELFGERFDRAIGPAAVRYADRGTFRPVESDGVRLLGPEDVEALDVLRGACWPAEWDHGGSEIGEHPVVGAFADGGLAAVAGYEVWGGTIAHVAIVTHPAHRGRGLGAAALSRVTAEALDRGLLAQHRALESNAPSIAIGDRLGFQPHSRSLAIRLAG